MLRSFAFWIFFASLSVIGTMCFAQVDAGQVAAKSFAIQGIGLGATVEAMQKSFPDAQDLSNPKDLEVGMTRYILDGVPNISTVVFYAYQKEIYSIRLVYDVDIVSRLGGWENVAVKFAEKYGKADPDSEGTATKDTETVADFFWRYPAVNRFIELVVKPKFMYIEFSDIKLVYQMQEAIKKSTNLGF